MKKISISLLLVLIVCFTGYSQKTTFGIKGGVTTNYLSIHDEEYDERIEGQRPGFYVGGLANIRLSENLSLQPNLLLAMKGATISEAKITTWHIEAPVNLLYTKGGFFVGAGPNFSYGLSGTVKTEEEPDGEFDIYSKEESDFLLKRFEAGVNVLIGYTFSNGILLSANFAHGFNNIFRGDNDYKYVVHSKTFGFSIGYMFGAKK